MLQFISPADNMAKLTNVDISYNVGRTEPLDFIDISTSSPGVNIQIHGGHLVGLYNTGRRSHAATLWSASHNYWG